jgi:signal transduction histidine kinase
MCFLLYGGGQGCLFREGAASILRTVATENGVPTSIRLLMGKAMIANSVPSDAYERILAEYLSSRGEEALYQASLLSVMCIQDGLGPEDIIALHFDCLERLVQVYRPVDRARANADGQQFLLEMMIAYGVRYREHLEMKLAESQRDAEARSARDSERALDTQRLERERADILATIAHELRTPLTAAMGQLALATRRLDGGQVEQVPPLLGSAQQALQRLSRLSADLAEVSRGEAPLLQPALHTLDELIDQACAWAQPSAAEKRIVLVRATDHPGPEVRVDPDAVLSILGNLLSNAIRYTPEGGQVVVRQDSDASSVRVEVQDSGIGIPPEVRERIFERFYRGPEARTMEAQGLGLGLSLVQQLVLAHGGRVEVDSEMGRGSIFRVLFPRGAPDSR